MTLIFTDAENERARLLEETRAELARQQAEEVNAWINRAAQEGERLLLESEQAHAGMLAGAGV